MKKNDYIVIAAVLFFAAIAVIFIFFQKKGAEVVISDGKKTYSYPINADRVIELGDDSGQYNIVVIRDGQVWVQEASCRNQICVHHKPVYKNGESIICVPNNVTVTVKSAVEKDIDN